MSEKPFLTRNNIHIWDFKIPLNEESYNYYYKMLSEDELERSSRFYFQKDRNEYVCCRGFLRETLSKYLSIPPEEISFDYGKYGKPELAVNGNSEQLKFNLSHSKGQAMLAITCGDEIGVDIELVKKIPEMFDIAKELYTENENLTLKNSMDKTEEIFFRFWTRKEAIIKAVGHGLSAPLVMIDVSASDNILVDKSFEKHALEFAGCRINDLNSPVGYSASVAFLGEPKSIEYFSILN